MLLAGCINGIIGLNLNQLSIPAARTLPSFPAGVKAATLDEAKDLFSNFFNSDNAINNLLDAIKNEDSPVFKAAYLAKTGQVFDTDNLRKGNYDELVNLNKTGVDLDDITYHCTGSLSTLSGSSHGTQKINKNAGKISSGSIIIGSSREFKTQDFVTITTGTIYKVAGTIKTEYRLDGKATITNRLKEEFTGSVGITNKYGVALTISNGTVAAKFRFTGSYGDKGEARGISIYTGNDCSDVEVYNNSNEKLGVLPGLWAMGSTNSLRYFPDKFNYFQIIDLSTVFN